MKPSLFPSTLPGNRLPVWRRVVPLALLLPLLTGCLLNRVFAVKAQFCDSERYFELELGAEARLTMRHPVLLARDMIWLAGAPPTERISEKHNLRLSYVLERDLPANPSYNLSSWLEFVRYRGKYRLQEGRLDRNLTSLLTPDLIRKAIAGACTLKPNISRRRAVIDLGEVDRSTLLSRQQVTTLLGPSAELDQDGAAVYRYRLQGQSKPSATARIRFDPDDGQMQRLRLQYLRFEVDADFREGLATIKFRL